jgi:hypothetical protein
LKLANQVFDNPENPFQKDPSVLVHYFFPHFLTFAGRILRNNESYIQEFILTKILLYKIASLFSPNKFCGTYLINTLKKFISEKHEKT